MECYTCKHSHVSTNMTGDEELISVVCEHDSFRIPRLLIHGFKNYIDSRPNNWHPERCPKGGD